MVLWRPRRTSRTNTPKRCPFHYRGLEYKVGSQEISGVTGKFGLGIQNEAGQRLIEFCQQNTLVIANTLFQQHRRRLCTWTSPDGQYQTQIDYILCSQRRRSSIQSAKTRLEADCSSDHEFLIAKLSVAAESPNVGNFASCGISRLHTSKSTWERLALQMRTLSTCKCGSLSLSDWWDSNFT